MRASRTLRARAKRATEKPETSEQEKPEGYRHSQTDGWAATERVDRRYEYGEHSHLRDMPIVFGFRPNEERA